ncbi:MAG TPA: enoyl-CoA hydratase-related protein, partial [Parvularculaceae bacterium]|nr:enoyl-CoA hydratase-related protein [Parvularculaceae bacterium]
MSYQCILLETDGDVGIVTLNRPDALNAFSDQLMNELTDALKKLDADDDIGCIVITGSEKAFAAGADIKEMASVTYMQAVKENFITRNWEEATRCRKPVIAAVAGYALGGGCELAMMADFIIAADNAKFGQPEITIGAMPGAGGTQRLARFIGKSKAMEMCLTGRMMDVDEAERCGLVSRIVPKGELKTEAIKTAKKIASFSRPIVMLTKDAVNRAFELPLTEGVRYER